MTNGFMRFMAHLALARPDAALIKASGGVPREVAGRRLDPKFQFLEAQARKRPAAPPTPAAARAATRQLVDLFGGRLDPGVKATPMTIPVTGRAIPARLYRPANQDPARGVLVYLHFGGGVVGDLDTCHAFCGMLARGARLAVVSVDYRLAPEHPWPQGLEDATAAFEWALANGEALGALPGRVSIGGDSMGGNFAAIIAQEMQRQGKPLPAVQLLIYPATDLASAHPSMSLFGDAFPLTKETMDWFMSQYLPPGADVKHPRLSPANAPSLVGLPPALVFTAGFDPLVDQGEDYAQKLASAGVETSYRCFDSLAHGFTAFTGAIPAARQACLEIVAAFAARLASADARAAQPAA